MPIDTDVQSFAEENANITDCNTKYTQLAPLCANTSLTSVDNNKIPVRRSGSWSIEGEEAYNGYYQDFGNISGEVVLTMNGDSCRTAMIATVVGNTFITGFGVNFLSGVVYTLFLKQNGTGGFSVRWPYGASILKSVGTDPDQMTEVNIVKLPSGKVFVRCEAFRNTTDVGAVIKEFESPNITFPDGSQAPLQFTWMKAPAVSYGGTLVGLFSDWEIADDALYTNLLFSSYNNTSDLYSIQVVLTQAGSVYMRTRFGGTIGGTPVLSAWDEAVVDVSGMGGGDKYWDQTVLCINANKYGWEGSRKIVDEKSYNTITLVGDTKIVDSSGKWAINFDGSGDSLSIPANVLNELKSGDYTFEFFIEFSNVAAQQGIWSKGGNWAQVGGQIAFFYTAGYISWAFANSGGTVWQIQSDQSQQGLAAIANNTKYHIAYSRSGNTIKMFLNGTTAISFSVASDHNDTSTYPLVFGTDRDFSGAPQSPMKIYSIRLTKNICRYTSDFTVDLNDPYFKTGNLWWTPEPKFISNEKFSDYLNWDKVVCCINAYGAADSTSFIDDGGGVVTAYGNAKIGVANNLSYINLDGTGDYLRTTADTNFFDKDFCLEWFLSRTNTAASGNIFCNRISGNTGILVGFNNSSPYGMYVSLGNGSWFFNQTYNLTVNTELFHLAIVRYNGTIYIYVNGTLFGSNVVSGTITAVTGYTTIGADLANTGMGYYPFNGKIYSFRASYFARYTSAFTVDLTKPYFITKPKVENWAETSLLVNAYGLPSGSTDIRDEKGNAFSVYGDTKVGVDSNGLQYINFDGTGDYLTSPNSTNMVFASGDFTVEAYIYPYSFDLIGGSTNRAILSKSISADGFSLIFGTSGNIIWYTASSILTSTVPLTANTLNHIAFVRISGVLYVYINGVQCGSASYTTNISSTAILYVGSSSLGSYYNGRIYSARLTKGKALYTSNFNVDLTNPYFPAIDSISDLWLDGNGYSKITLATGVSKIIDKSGNMREAVQATAASQPALVQNAQNGLMALNFDGVDDYLTTADNDVLDNTKYTIIVQKPNVTGQFQGLLDKWNGTGPVGWMIDFGPTATQGKPRLSSNATSLVGPDSVHGIASIIEAQLSGSSSFIGTPAGVTSGTLSVPTNVSDSLCFGGDGVSTLFTDLDLYEVLLFSSILSEFWRKIFHGYVAHKWGLTDNLPATHPYKTVFPSEDSRTDDYWYATVLCINGTDIIRPTEIVDSRRMIKLNRSGNVSVIVDTNNKPYFNFTNTTFDSIYFNSSSLVLGSSDFTIEWFIYKTANNPNHSRIFSAGATSDTTYHALSIGIGASGELTIYCSSNGSSWNLLQYASGPVLNSNEMYHVAVVRNGGNLFIFINGNKTVVSTGLGATVLSANGSERAIGGQSAVTNRSLIGRIYSTRITKGIARYTENFDVDLTNPYFPKKASFICGKNGSISGILYDGAKTITEVLGSADNVDSWVDASGGGRFKINSGGSWWFFADNDFSYLYGDNTTTTSVSYRVSDGVSEDEGTLTVTVSAASAPTLWTSAEITPAAWWDASDSSARVLDVSAISQLSDKSGNARHATMTGSSRPTLVGNFAVFDGVDDYMSISVPQASPCHVFDVIDTSDSLTGYRAVMNRSIGSAPYPPCLFIGVDTGSYKPSVYWGTSKLIVDATARQNLRIQEYRMAPGVVGLRANGGTEQTAGHSQTALSTWIEIGTVNTYSQQGKFKLGERVIINSALSDADRKKVEGYLAHKWDALLGVTTLVDSLPVDHPYKSAPPTI